MGYDQNVSEELLQEIECYVWPICGKSNSKPANECRLDIFLTKSKSKLKDEVTNCI